MLDSSADEDFFLGMKKIFKHLVEITGISNIDNRIVAGEKITEVEDLLEKYLN